MFLERSERYEPEVLAQEEDIVWLEDPDEIRLTPYVRESTIETPWRRKKPKCDVRPGRLLGYAILKPEAKSDFPYVFSRRIFWLDQDDPWEDGCRPLEAVDPCSLEPGVSSKISKRGCVICVNGLESSCFIR